MPGSTEMLFSAIAADDSARVEELLRAEPKLARDAFAKAPLLEQRLPHWIYVNDSALHAAAAGYRVEIAEALLAYGADPNSARNHRRSRPLHYAADGCPGSPRWNAKRQGTTIRLLLKHGAEIDAQDKNGATALHRAVRTRCAGAVRSLLAAGADSKMRNKPGATPFHLAVQNTGRGGSGREEAKSAQREIIQIFLDHGLSPGLKDARGKTVLQWARSEWIRSLLSGRGEKT